AQARTSAGTHPKSDHRRRELGRLRAAMNGAIDTSDVPAQRIPGRYPLVRDSRGRIPRKPPSVIRDAILNELAGRGMSRYQLWKLARRYCPTLPNSAVYELLLGTRAISVVYCEALLRALGLGVAPLRKSA
ncbi:MAG: hypothetical protein ACREJC_19450, partial [Tepidisphaeraceae bacterium]